MKTSSPTIPKKQNPLASFMRQPKIYIRFPSEGQYWPEGSLEISETGEYPVYSMTAKDELMLKIPDAVMTGQAVVDVLQHCIPNIKNAWMTPSIDLDYLLIAVRMATYGEKMDTPVNFGEGDDELTLNYDVDLRLVMDAYQQQVTWDPVVPITEDLTVFVRPLNYKVVSENALKAFETQKIMQIVNDENATDENKLEAFNKSFNKLTEVTIGIVRSSIFKVDSSEGSTDDPFFIQEFVDNVDKEIFTVVQKHLEALKEINTLKPLTIQVTEEMREKGFKGETLEVPLVFDPTTFFV